MQKSFRILVGTTLDSLSKNVGDLWDSGKVVSQEQNNIQYGGSPLTPGQRCYWKVQIWDGQSSPRWSPVSKWEMGLMHPKNWTGQWLNDGKPTPTTDEAFYADDPAPLFRHEFRMDKAIARARLYISGLGYYEASFNLGLSSIGRRTEEVIEVSAVRK